MNTSELSGAMALEGIDLQRATQLLDMASHCNEAVLIWGDPGVGKTEMVKSRRRIMENGELEPMVVISGSMADPTVIYGIPTISVRTFASGNTNSENTDLLEMTDKKEVNLIPMSWMVDMIEANQGLIFIDELTTCPPMIQAALLKLTLEREVHGHKLPLAVNIFAAANFAGKIVGGSELTPPLTNRFVHAHYSPTTENWLDGESMGWERVYRKINSVTFGEIPADLAEVQKAKILAFIENSRGDLAEDIGHRSEGSGQFSTHRNWSRLIAISQSIDFSVKGDGRQLFRDCIDGLVGLGKSARFFSYTDNLDIPSLAELRKNPTKAWPRILNRGWVVMTLVAALVDWIEDQEINKFNARPETTKAQVTKMRKEILAAMQAILWLGGPDCAKLMTEIRKETPGAVSEPADAIAKVQSDIVAMLNVTQVPGNPAMYMAQDPDFKGIATHLNEIISEDMGSISDLMGDL